MQFQLVKYILPVLQTLVTQFHGTACHVYCHMGIEQQILQFPVVTEIIGAQRRHNDGLYVPLFYCCGQVVAYVVDGHPHHLRMAVHRLVGDETLERKLCRGLHTDALCQCHTTCQRPINHAPLGLRVGDLCFIQRLHQNT